MGSTQPHRNDRAQAWTSGSCNRGFVSCDPERQAESLRDDSPRNPKAPRRDQFAFVVQQLAEAARRHRERERAANAAADRRGDAEQEPQDPRR
jgi:hypothetical protein